MQGHSGVKKGKHAKDLHVGHKVRARGKAEKCITQIILHLFIYSLTGTTLPPVSRTYRKPKDQGVCGAL